MRVKMTVEIVLDRNEDEEPVKEPTTLDAKLIVERALNSFWKDGRPDDLSQHHWTGYTVHIAKQVKE